tara:strand:- start:128 stop:565 length:438 start_codon:yes stop_codon:yes gene_type:complete
MKLEKKHYYWIGAAALITVIGVVVYKKKKKRKAALATKNIKAKNKINGGNSKDSSADVKLEENVSPFPIKIGAQGDAVKAIQKYMNSTCPSDLKKASIYPLEINGIWDEITEKATLACSVLKRNKIDKESFDRILRDLQSANISV